MQLQDNFTLTIRNEITHGIQSRIQIDTHPHYPEVVKGARKLLPELRLEMGSQDGVIEVKVGIENRCGKTFVESCNGSPFEINRPLQRQLLDLARKGYEAVEKYNEAVSEFDEEDIREAAVTTANVLIKNPDRIRDLHDVRVSFVCACSPNGGGIPRTLIGALDGMMRGDMSELLETLMEGGLHRDIILSTPGQIIVPVNSHALAHSPWREELEMEYMVTAREAIREVFEKAIAGKAEDFKKASEVLTEQILQKLPADRDRTLSSKKEEHRRRLESLEQDQSAAKSDLEAEHKTAKEALGKRPKKADKEALEAEHSTAMDELEAAQAEAKERLSQEFELDLKEISEYFDMQGQEYREKLTETKESIETWSTTLTSLNDHSPWDFGTVEWPEIDTMLNGKEADDEAGAATQPTAS